MKNFRVQWSETLHYDETIEAETETEAVEIFNNNAYESSDREDGELQVTEIV